MAVLGYAFQNAQSVREACSGTYKTEIAQQALVIAALATAIAAAETFTTTISTTGSSAQDTENTMRNLNALGFTVVLSGSTLTITW